MGGDHPHAQDDVRASHGGVDQDGRSDVSGAHFHQVVGVCVMSDDVDTAGQPGLGDSGHQPIQTGRPVQSGSHHARQFRLGEAPSHQIAQQHGQHQLYGGRARPVGHTDRYTP